MGYEASLALARTFYETQQNKINRKRVAKVSARKKAKYTLTDPDADGRWCHPPIKFSTGRNSKYTTSCEGCPVYTECKHYVANGYMVGCEK